MIGRMKAKTWTKAFMDQNERNKTSFYSALVKMEARSSSIRFRAIPTRQFKRVTLQRCGWIRIALKHDEGLAQRDTGQTWLDYGRVRVRVTVFSIGLGSPAPFAPSFHRQIGRWSWRYCGFPGDIAQKRRTFQTRSGDPGYSPVAISLL